MQLLYPFGKALGLIFRSMARPLEVALRRARLEIMKDETAPAADDTATGVGMDDRGVPLLEAWP